MLCHSLEIMDYAKFKKNNKKWKKQVQVQHKSLISDEWLYPTYKIFYCGKKLCRSSDLKT